MLFETLVTEEKYVEYENIFNMYRLHWIPAKKPTVGRPSEGYLFGIKLCETKNVHFVEINEITLIEIQLTKNKLFILPVYLNYNLWQHQFDKMYNLINEFTEQNLMIIGDLNARIGQENIAQSQKGVNTTENRTSRDLKMNVRGKKVIEMCFEFGFDILNGKTKGDEDGEFTYVSKNGASVIDLALVRGSWLDIVENFQVKNKPYTEHLPIVIDITVKTREEESMKLIPKLKWIPSKREHYCNKIKSSVHNINCGSENVDELNEHIVNAIKSAAEQMNKEKVEFRAKWYDWECWRNRKECYRLLNMWRKSQSQETRNYIFKTLNSIKIYVQEKKKYT